MLQSLFRRAEATVDNAIASVLARALVALPFVVAAGFGTAALAIYAYENLGVAGGNLLVAGVFCAIGLVCVAVVGIRAKSHGETDAASSEQQAAAEAAAGSKPLLDSVDRDVVAAMVTAAGPIALPFVMRSVMRNLPLLAAIAAAGFVLSRNGGENEKDIEAPMQPAE
jgi:hypothetical protein